MVCLLLTRPAAASQRFWEQLPAELRSQVNPVFSPLLKIEPLVQELDISTCDAVIFTSSNGVNIASRSTALRKMAYCVGERTTEQARALGWRATCLGRTADELVASLSKEEAPKVLLHLHGRHTRGNIVARLRAAGHSCAGMEIYDQQARELTAEAKDCLEDGQLCLVPLFSPRSSQQFVYECAEPKHVYFVALSTAVAEPLNSLGYRGLKIAQMPDVMSMIKSVCDVTNELLQLERSQRAQ